MARKCAFLDIDATAFKKLILSNVGSEEGGARQPGFPNAADKEDLYAKVRSRSGNYSVTPSLAFSLFPKQICKKRIRWFRYAIFTGLVIF